jgi:hypothetical protein
MKDAIQPAQAALHASMGLAPWSSVQVIAPRQPSAVS